MMSIFSKWGLGPISVIVLAACSSDPPKTTTPMLVDSTPLVVAPTFFFATDSSSRVLADGDAISFWKPPQGGQVLLIGAQVQGLEGDGMQLRATTARPDGTFVAEEGRDVAVVDVPGKDGWKQPVAGAYTQVANVPVCPDQDSVDDVGQPLVITVDVQETHSGLYREGQATVTVTPACTAGSSDDQTMCTCECSAGYTLGKCGAPPR